jgi:hypothetical protein
MPPDEVCDYQFSYSRSTGKMRWRLDGHEWLTWKEVGRWRMLGADGRTGNLRVRCRLVIRGDTAYTYLE